MPEIAFLLGDAAQASNDNHERLPAAFRAAGWGVTTLPHEAVRMQSGRVRLGDHDPQRFQLVWLVGFGPAASFLDRMQLLRLVDQSRFVNAVDALVHLHAKTAWTSRMPETHVSNDPRLLGDIVDGGGDWVVKPTAGSFGRDVWRLTPGPDARQLLARLIGDTGRYCMLQRFVAGIEAGEKRTVVAGGRLIGTYLRRPEETTTDGVAQTAGQADRPESRAELRAELRAEVRAEVRADLRAEFRANLATGGAAAPASLTHAERHLVEEIAAELDLAGIGFAAIDTVYPYLMEVNVANPGGLGTMATLYGTDFTPAVVDALLGRGRNATRVQ